MKRNYLFDELCINKNSKYIFQIPKKRKLTSVYHSHDFYEIVYLTEGSVEKIINDEIYELSSPSLIVMFPGDSHSFISQNENASIFSLSIKEEEFVSLINCYDNNGKNIINSKSPLIFEGNEYPYQSLLDAVILDANNENKLKLFTFSLFDFIIEIQKDDATIPADLRNAIKLMKKDENITKGVEKFVELSNYSQSHLSRLMKKHYNMNSNEFIKNLRLEHAYNEIIMSKNHLIDIAENAGYQSFSHFNQIFKKKYGISPSALRKKHKINTV